MLYAVILHVGHTFPNDFLSFLLFFALKNVPILTILKSEMFRGAKVKWYVNANVAGFFLLYFDCLCMY